MLSASLGMYSVEHNAQPENFKNAFSGMWWSVSALLTVGYGDIVPITTLGKLMGTFITMLGVGIVAIPTGIISAGFVEQYTKAQNQAKKKKIEGRRRSTENVIVESDSPYIGDTIRKVEDDYKISVAVIIRNDILVLPEDNVVIEEGDTIVYQHI